eukprot:2109353-Rhodomonas_salina.1
MQKLHVPHSGAHDLHAMSADSDAGVVQMARSLYAVLESYEKKMANMVADTNVRIARVNAL